VAQWHSGRALDLRSTGCWLDSCHHAFRCSLAQVVHSHVPLLPNSTSLVLAQAGKVNVVTMCQCHRHSGLSTYGLNGLRLGDEHPAYASLGPSTLYFFRGR